MVPATDGVSCTVIVQLAFAATVVPHELDGVKLPLATIEEMVKVLVALELVRVTECAVEVTPTTTLPNPRDAGFTLTTGGGGGLE